MNVENITLEITRRCTLDCEHCFRGDSQNINMSIQTLENIFCNIKSIDQLVITGGEPLIAINELEKLVELLRSNNVKIGIINLVTNGTILSSRVLKVLKNLSELSNLNLKISFDAFHLLELEKKNLKEKRDNNVKVLKDIFNAKEYGDEDKVLFKKDDRLPQSLQPIGRVKKLNTERLTQINSLVVTKYVVLPFVTWNKPTSRFENGKLCGSTTIDVNGNIVGYGLSFEDEDNYAENRQTNINEFGFIGAVNNFISIEESKTNLSPGIKK